MRRTTADQTAVEGGRSSSTERISLERSEKGKRETRVERTSGVGRESRDKL